MTASSNSPALAPPTWRQRTRELRIGRDLAMFPLHATRLLSVPQGHGRPVVLVPGFGSTDRALLPLRSFLRRAGFDARPARMGRIGDDVEAQYPILGERCAQIAADRRRPVAVVGWSIGGVLAREAARDDPAAIDRVVTFGTPVEGGPSFTSLASRYDPADLAAIRDRIDERNGQPISVPVTAIWSNNDGIVTPAACVDRRTPGVENIEVASTHVGMGVDPAVWALVAERLAPASQVA